MEFQDRLRAYVDRHGLFKASKKLKFAEGTIARLVAGLSHHSNTRELMELRLDKLEAEDREADEAKAAAGGASPVAIAS